MEVAIQASDRIIPDAFPQSEHIPRVLDDYLLRDGVFQELRGLQAKGWAMPQGDQHFAQKRANADHANARTRKAFFNMMQRIGDEIQQQTRAFSMEEEWPRALDFCAAPGGFVAYLLRSCPKCTVDAFSLPQDQGGHELLLRCGKDDRRVRICFADITMFADQFEINLIAKDHPERSTLLQSWPYESVPYDLILCDGQVLRTQPLPHYRKACEATRLINAQLFLGLKMIKTGGTMIILLHKAYSVQSFRLIHMFDSFSEVQLHKPNRYHKERSSFYLVAKKIRPRSLQAIEAMSLFKELWTKATFQDEASYGDECMGGEPQDLDATVERFGPRFVELARPIWQTQVEALREAKWMKGC